MNSSLIKYNESLIKELTSDNKIDQTDKKIMEKMLNFVLLYPGVVSKEDFEKIIEEEIK
jgi:hypothetical protein